MLTCVFLAYVFVSETPAPEPDWEPERDLVIEEVMSGERLPPIDEWVPTPMPNPRDFNEL